MIKIEQLLPLLRKGWVAMGSDGDWWWHEVRPYKDRIAYGWYARKDIRRLSSAFDIAPVENWKESLIRVTGDSGRVYTEELEKTKKQLKVALNGLFEIANNPSPDFNRILYAREVWHKVKELNK